MRRDQKRQRRNAGPVRGIWGMPVVGAVLACLFTAGCTGGNAPPPPPPVRLIDLDYGRGAADAAPATDTAAPGEKIKKGAKPVKRLRAPRPGGEQTSVPPDETGRETAIEREGRLRTILHRLDGEASSLDRQIERYDRRDRFSVGEIDLYGTSRGRNDATILRRLDLERRGVEDERRSAGQDLDRLIFEERLRGPSAGPR